MHDDAIERRTALRLESETEEQAQALLDFKLKKEYERAEANRTLEKEKIVHKQEMETMEHTRVMERKLQDHNAAVARQKELDAMEIQKMAALKVI